MPLYEYECENCGSRFEVIQRFSDAPVATCRQCAGPVHRLLSPPAIQFKGTGWYVTDYRKSGGGAGTAASAEAPAGTTAKAGDEKKASETPASSHSSDAAKKD